MARRRAAASDEDSRRFLFTRTSVQAAQCPPGKSQALFWDTDQPGLGLRVTAGGARSFIFESRLGSQTVRVTIGPASMPIRSAKDRAGRPVTTGASGEAAKLAALVAQGIDPRAEKAAAIARQAQERAEAKAQRQRLEVTGLQAWDAYCTERTPHWSERNLADHIANAKAGGVPRVRSREPLTKPGPLRALLDRPLAAIDTEAVEQWVTRETRARPARAALGFRQLRAFVNWCAEHPEYRDIVIADACKGRRTREKLGRPKAKEDALQREQLTAWFAAVRQSVNPVAAAYLQALLLTGARREELLGLRWDDVDFRWKALRIRDKVEGERTIPLTPFVAALLRELQVLNARPPVIPRRLRGADPATLPQWKPSSWVFASRAAESGRLQEPRLAHNRALATAGLPHITLHGLRRSFGTLAEWVECPVGIVAQIQGHKPSAIAEKHYRVRPLDLLRLWHERIETWMLEQAGVEQPSAETGALRMVQATS